MANFYLDNSDLKHHLHHPLMKKLVALRERNYSDAETYDNAPFNFEDSMDSYEKVLEIAGEISGEIVAANAEDVDHEGPHVVDGHVVYAKGTQKNLDALVKAGLMGISIPRRYNGLNFSLVPYIMAADMVSRADAGFVNIWGLQDCAETIYEFANEEQKQKYLPRVCAGETMAMDLTEPDAGSDLQAVMLKATYSEADGCWYLNGVKRFITNGDGHIALVLARSEEGTKDVSQGDVPHVEAKAAAGAARSIVGIHPRVSELVVPGPLLLVGEDAVRLVHFLEFGLCGLVPGVDVRVVLFRQLSVSLFYFIVRSALAHAQDFIVITILFWHNITNF